MNIINEQTANDEGRSWIVCYNVGSQDQWAVFETLEEAKALYNETLKDDDVYISSICAVIESSDYEPHRAFT